jgi:hypothetical protein
MLERRLPDGGVKDTKELVFAEKFAHGCLGFLPLHTRRVPDPGGLVVAAGG